MEPATKKRSRNGCIRCRIAKVRVIQRLDAHFPGEVR